MLKELGSISDATDVLPHTGEPSREGGGVGRGCEYRFLAIPALLTKRSI